MGGVKADFDLKLQREAGLAPAVGEADTTLNAPAHGGQRVSIVDIVAVVGDEAPDLGRNTEG